eukprot:5745682-Pyramimonas_sp.AAC.2
MGQEANLNLADVLANVHIQYVSEVWQKLSSPQARAKATPRMAAYRVASRRLHHSESETFYTDDEIRVTADRIPIQDVIRRRLFLCV